MEATRNNSPDAEPAATVPPTPVLPYCSPNTASPGPTASDTVTAAFGIIVAIAMFAVSVWVLVGIFACAIAGYAFVSIGLLVPLAVCLAGGLAALRGATAKLRGTDETDSLKAVGYFREWRDIPGAIFAGVFGVVFLTLLVLLTPDFFSGPQSPKKMLASAMIVCVLVFGAMKSWRSAWINMGGFPTLGRLAGRKWGLQHHDVE